MLNRRGILRLLGGGVAAGATIDPKDVMREVAKGKGFDGVLLGDENIFNTEASDIYEADNSHEVIDKLMTSAFWDYNEAMGQAYHQMPVHIANKKSWSPAFKQSEAFKEAYHVIRARRELERNPSMAEKVAKKFGFG